MFAISATSLASGAAFLGGGKQTLRSAQSSGARNTGRAGPVTTKALFGFGGGPKQVRK
jgi:hypothetical protein